MNKDNQTIVKLKCSNVLKSKYMEVFFDSFCTLTIIELINKMLPWAVVVIGNSHFSVSQKHISNHDISAASFSAVVFCFKSKRSKMHVMYTSDLCSSKYNIVSSCGFCLREMNTICINGKSQLWRVWTNAFSTLVSPSVFRKPSNNLFAYLEYIRSILSSVFS